jgi:ABC-type lipoprotein release transport system permease subunit
LSRTVVYEGIILGAIALGVGGLVTFPVLVWWHTSPPDLSAWIGGFDWSGAQWRPVLRVEYSLRAPILSALALLVTTIVSALYPAWKATRVPPADALADR